MRPSYEPTRSLLGRQEVDTVREIHTAIHSDERLGEDELVEYTEELFGLIRSAEDDWKQSVRDELEPDTVDRKAVKLKYLAEKLDELYQEHRLQSNDFGRSPESMYLKANDVITYVNELGTSEFYDTAEIQEGDFCLIQDGPTSWENAYSSPQSVTKRDVLQELYPRANN